MPSLGESIVRRIVGRANVRDEEDWMKIIPPADLRLVLLGWWLDAGRHDEPLSCGEADAKGD